ncbi:hypothetical protein K0O23_10525 [Pontibacter aydingkolensis]|uniref:Helix-hairpin-helix motif-containing protein n=2 Tax=Pontibacter aydingkolensis TaxID=1911536 RepID=A0ABS7CUH0_9BACT|nr:hypothetical protein [Pontibacter aydingkolensis]
MKEDFKLENLPKHNVYQVPEHYFDRLPMHVMERTAGAENKVPTWQRSLWAPLRIAVAPLVLLLVFVGAFYFTLQQQKQDDYFAMHPMAEHEIMDYLNYNEDLETADLAELSYLSKNEFTADFLNISPTAAEEELEYYHIRHLEE